MFVAKTHTPPIPLTMVLTSDSCQSFLNNNQPIALAASQARALAHALAHGAKQGPAGLRVALEPHANFKIDVSVAANGFYASKPIADLGRCEFEKGRRWRWTHSDNFKSVCCLLLICTRVVVDGNLSQTSLQHCGTKRRDAFRHRAGARFSELCAGKYFL